MVGREAELLELRRQLDVDRNPQVALVTGEAGVGKSRLVREFLSLLPPGTIVLGGQAEEGDLHRPYELLRDAVEPTVTRWDDVPTALRSRAHALGHVLAPLLPDPHHVDDHDHTSDELLRAGLELVRHLTGGRPAVLVLEDLHWADAESVALFGGLATTPDLALLIIGTFRPEDFDRRHPLAGLLPSLERQRPVTHLSLSRLQRHELAAMLEAVYGRAPSAETVLTLHRRTQGNPFFVEELIATAGTDDPEALDRVALPWNAAEAVLRRLDALAPQERAVADAAAVLATRVRFDLLAAVCDISEDRLIVALRELVARGLLIEGDNDSFTFRHALTREAVAEQLLGRQRRRLHQKALAALRQAGEADDALLAHHAAGAGHHAELVTHATTGAERYLRQGSGFLAVRLAEQGLSAAEQLPVAAVADELALRSVATRGALAVGLLDVATRHAEQWRLLAGEARTPVEEAAALRHLALLRFYSGDLPGYWRRIGEALEVAERLGPSEETGWVLAYRSQGHMLVDEHEAAIEWAERAIAVADQVDAPAVRAYALVNKGTALCSLPGRAKEGARLLDEARDTARRSGDMVTLIRGYANGVLFELETQRYARARLLLEEGWGVADRHGLSSAAASIAGLGVHLALCEGDAAAAYRWLGLGRRVVAAPSSDLWLLAVDGLLAAERDDRESAAGVLARLRGEAQRRPSERASASVGQLATTIAARARNAPAAREALTEYRDGIAAAGGCVQLDVPWILAVEALSAGVDVASVRAFLDAITPGPRDGATVKDGYAPADRRVAGWSSHLEGMVCERLGNAAEAADAYRLALAAPQLWRPATAIADLHQRLARCQDLLGDRAGAREQAASAVETLDGWPGHRREAAETLLRRLEGETGSGLLTPRETEVVALLAEGLTNRQIANRLFIAVKTVAVHVSNILAKTGLSTRTEVAAWALRSGVVDSAASS
jgi:DNA-binding CsgD family transcriptional regulator